MTAFLFHWKFLFQNVRGGFELHDLLCSDLDGLTRSGVTALSGRTLVHSHSTETDEGDFAVLLQFSFGDIHDGVDGLSCIDLGHTGLFSDGID